MASTAESAEARAEAAERGRSEAAASVQRLTEEVRDLRSALDAAAARERVGESQRAELSSTADQLRGRLDMETKARAALDDALRLRGAARSMQQAPAAQRAGGVSPSTCLPAHHQSLGGPGGAGGSRSGDGGRAALPPYTLHSMDFGCSSSSLTAAPAAAYGMHPTAMGNGTDAHAFSARGASRSQAQGLSQDEIVFDGQVDAFGSSGAAGAVGTRIDGVGGAGNGDGTETAGALARIKEEMRLNPRPSPFEPQLRAVREALAESTRSDFPPPSAPVATTDDADYARGSARPPLSSPLETRKQVRKRLRGGTCARERASRHHSTHTHACRPLHAAAC